MLITVVVVIFVGILMRIVDAMTVIAAAVHICISIVILISVRLILILLLFLRLFLLFIITSLRVVIILIVILILMIVAVSFWILTLLIARTIHEWLIAIAVVIITAIFIRSSS